VCVSRRAPGGSPGYSVPVVLPARTVLVDLDDTLFDHSHSALAGLATVRARFDALARIDLAELAALHAKHLEATHLRVLSGELTLEDARTVRFRAIARDCGAPSSAAAELADAYREGYQRARRAVPGAVELLRALRAHARVCVVTNNLVAEQVEKLAHLEMTDLVDVLVISEEAGVAKPDPAIFRIALARCDTPADSAVMLGDSWAADVLGARAAGIRAVWLNRSNRSCPDPEQCLELISLSPTAQVVERLLGAGDAAAER
jgi:HAD superfamily hydrolase (TIGR01549 family)